MKKIIEKVRRGIIPTKKLEQEKSRVATIAFDLVDRQVSKYPQIVQVEFGGSYAKGTWIPEKADIDIFLKFKKTTPQKKFSEYQILLYYIFSTYQKCFQSYF